MGEKAPVKSPEAGNSSNLSAKSPQAGNSSNLSAKWPEAGNSSNLSKGAPAEKIQVWDVRTAVPEIPAHTGVSSRFVPGAAGLLLLAAAACFSLRRSHTSRRQGTQRLEGGYGDLEQMCTGAE